MTERDDEARRRMLRDALFDPKARIGVSYEAADGAVLVTVYQAERVLGRVAVPDPGFAAAIRATPAMLFFPEEIRRVQEMLAAGATMNIEFREPGTDRVVDPGEVGEALRDELQKGRH